MPSIVLRITHYLRFGLRSAPKIFTAIADVAEWVIKQEGVHFVIHYLDDFLLVGASASPECMGPSILCLVLLISWVCP